MNEDDAEHQNTENEEKRKHPGSKSMIGSNEFIPCPIKESYTGLDMIKHLDQMFWQEFGAQDSPAPNQRKEGRHE
jgi:hypothetical protein